MITTKLKTQTKRAANITYIMAHNLANRVVKKHNSNKNKTTEYTTNYNITTTNKKHKNNKDTRYDDKLVNGKSNSCRR